MKFHPLLLISPKLIDNGSQSARSEFVHAKAAVSAARVAAT
jgi:hypothetical protein